MTNYLTGSKERSYEAEQAKIQSAVDLFYGAKGNTRFTGKRQYPLLGRAETTKSALNVHTTTQNLVDDQDPFNTSTAGLWNPKGGIQGADLSATTIWVDDNTDGVRDIDSSAGTADSWNSVSVTRAGSDYEVDPRYYLVDFDALVSEGYLQSVPDSASDDNKPSGSTDTYSGNYMWYVDERGVVKSLYREFPDTTGHVAGVFP